MRAWDTTLRTDGGVGSKNSYTTSFKTYNLRQAGRIMNEIRAAEKADGLPKRKINPMSVYLLEELTRMYFESYASKGGTLISIDIEERNG